MRHGLIARADVGGLGVQTYEYAAHLRPDRILLIDPGSRGRGRARPDQWHGHFDHVISTDLSLDLEALAGFAEGLDVVFTVECAYRHALGDYLAKRGVTLVVQANPELYRASDLGEHVVVLPTPWREELFARGTIVLPVPVNRAALAYRHRDRVRQFLHICAPAMADRAGTNLVIACAPFVQQRTQIVMHVPYGCAIPDGLAGRGDISHVGNVTFILRTNEVADYADIYTDDVDALLAPRRYGGLSLPMQEAASRGMPIVSLSLDPQSHWPGVMLVPASDPDKVPMKGGTFDVWGCDPHDLAMAIDKLTTDDGLVGLLSRMADERAGLLDWERWRQPYLDMLGDVVS